MIQPARSLNRPDRTVLMIAGLVLAVVALAVVVALTTGNRPPASFPADSPEATFQRYLTAVERRDPDAAYALLSAKVQGQVSLETFRRDWGFSSGYDEHNSRVRIDQTIINGDQATMTITIDAFYGTGVEARRTQRSQTIYLVREGGVWRIDERLGRYL